MSLNLMRQEEVFQAREHKGKKVAVVGVGTVGSRLVDMLVRVGMENVDVYDDDEVEEHNVPNQLYGINGIGRRKVEELFGIVDDDLNIEISDYPRKITKDNGFENIPEIAVLAVDTMAARTEIFNHCIKGRDGIKLMIETRMGAYSGRVYAINPHNKNQVTRWEETICGDDEAEVSACGASISMAPMGALVASMATWQIIRWLKGEEVENEILFATAPWRVLTRNFS